MSKINICDFCGATSRDTEDWFMLKLPRKLLPDTIVITGGSNSVADVEACETCAEDFPALLDEFQSRRMGGWIPDQP
jgi:hypothetical protein